jgi:hypothetical protein
VRACVEPPVLTAIVYKTVPKLRCPMLNNSNRRHRRNDALGDQARQAADGLGNAAGVTTPACSSAADATSDRGAIRSKTATREAPVTGLAPTQTIDIQTGCQLARSRRTHRDHKHMCIAGCVVESVVEQTDVI